MKFRSLLLLLIALMFLGMAKKPDCNIRFYTVANKKDGAPFIRAVQIGDPPRTIYVSKIPAIHEGDIASVYPFPAADGTWGCGLKIRGDSMMRLATVTVENRGQPMICVVNGRLVTAMMIDKEIKDGILFISAGLTADDIYVIKKRYPVMGSKKKKKNKESLEKEKQEPAGQHLADD